MSVLWVKSSHAGPPPSFDEPIRSGDLVVVDQRDLTPETLLAHRGLVTANQLDQDAMLALRDWLAAFLDGGGRWFLNGHMVRPIVEGLAQYRPIANPKRADLDLRPLAPHPVFDGLDLHKLETNRGVAGFYGRGCNPLPEGAVAVNGLGPARVPVDWVWARPGGGRVFSHAGNDLATLGLEWDLAPLLARRIVEWADGGACLDGREAVGAPADDLPLVPAEAYCGRKSDPVGARQRIVAASTGTYYGIHAVEGARYRDAFDVVCTPEALANVLTPADVLWVPCRTPAQRMIAVRGVVARHLAAGGTVIALGESRSDLWLPTVRFISKPTNWWWWLDPASDLGVRITAPDHPLVNGMGREDVSWHLHGWFEVPDGAEVLATDAEGRPIFYVDAVSTPGRMVVSSLDPMFHHGSHFMPATTRFLDRFVPNLKGFIDA